MMKFAKEYEELVEKLNEACTEGIGGFYEWEFEDREGMIDDYICDWECNGNYEHKIEQLKFYIAERGIEFGL